MFCVSINHGIKKLNMPGRRRLLQVGKVTDV